MNSARNLYRHDLDFRALALEDADFARCLKPNGQLDFNNPDVVRYVEALPSLPSSPIREPPPSALTRGPARAPPPSLTRQIARLTGHPQAAHENAAEAGFCPARRAPCRSPVPPGPYLSF
ncbi:hypothetical protein LOY91_006148 [Ophidiomyces ophidiicola]|nr:hypothetical protein LOY91_006148 [Ophidiomyces ophidiicola]